MRDPAPWQKKYEVLFGLACLFGLAGQYLFVNHAAGISVPLFVLAFYGLFFYGVQGRLGGFDSWQGQSRSAKLLYIPILLLTLTYSLYANDFFRFFNPLVISSLIIMQTIMLTRVSTKRWDRPAFYTDVLRHAIARPIAQLRVPFELIGGLMKWREGHSQTGTAIRKILLGLLIASPLILIVVVLLSSADTIFMAWVNAIPDLLPTESVDDVVGRVIVAAVLALYAFCYIVGLLFRRPEERKLSEQIKGQNGASISATPVMRPVGLPVGLPGEEKVKEKGVDPLIAGTLLVSVNIVYVLFAAIQFSYLFGGASGLLPEGDNYAEYARSGFAELVLVSLINIGLTLFGLQGVRKSSAAAEMLRRSLLTLLIGCTVVMLVSAYSRLSLYEQAYGFTQLRLLAHGFMVYLGLLLIIALVRIWHKRLQLVKSALTLTLAFYVAMNYINMDARIAENNIARYEASGQLDMRYLSRLSIDAAPALKRLHAKEPERQDITQAVAEMKERADSGRGWQSWSVARMRAQ